LAERRQNGSIVFITVVTSFAAKLNACLWSNKRFTRNTKMAWWIE